MKWPYLFGRVKRERRARMPAGRDSWENIGRNDPCPCGRSKKCKRSFWRWQQEAESVRSAGSARGNGFARASKTRWFAVSAAAKTATNRVRAASTMRRRRHTRRRVPVDPLRLTEGRPQQAKFASVDYAREKVLKKRGSPPSVLARLRAVFGK